MFNILFVFHWVVNYISITSTYIALVEKGLVIQNFGNSSIKIEKNYFAIKPSGVNLNKLKLNDIPIIRISDGKTFFNKLKPSVDTPIHQEIYKKCPLQIQRQLIRLTLTTKKNPHRM